MSNQNTTMLYSDLIEVFRNGRTKTFDGELGWLDCPIDVSEWVWLDEYETQVVQLRTFSTEKAYANAHSQKPHASWHDVEHAPRPNEVINVEYDDEGVFVPLFRNRLVKGGQYGWWTYPLDSTSIYAAMQRKSKSQGDVDKQKAQSLKQLLAKLDSGW